MNKLSDIVAKSSYGLWICISACLFTGCSVKTLAVNSLADALSEGNAGVYAKDDDPELIGDALPFALKTMESLLEVTPRHKKLLVATASGFVMYGHAYVLRPANAMESSNLDAAREQRARAKRLFLRARNYGLRALELTHPFIADSLLKNHISSLSLFRKEDVPALYWTAAAWGSAISVAKSDMTLVGNFPVVVAMMERALQLDEAWAEGSIHEFFIILCAGRSESEGGGIKRAEEHFKRAMELNEGRSISPLVTLAESVCIAKQDRKQFEELLTKAQEFDFNRYPENRLANIIAQNKAKALMMNIDNLFFQGDQEKLPEDVPK